MDSYKTVRTCGQGEYVEKKSRFIGAVWHAESYEEAEAYLQAARKKYYDARHNCFACIVGAPGTPEEILRSNDDGEPGGTAGKPMLEVLTGAGLHYTAAVVTRYFGGTLLGTGGLVRSYTAAIKAAIENAEVIEIISGMELVIRVTYPQAGKLQYVFARENLPAAEIEYGQDVVMRQRMPAKDAARVRKLIIEHTDGKAEFLEENETEYISH